MSLRFVFFDLDDTLLDHRAAERAALADVRRQRHAELGHHDLAHLQATYHAHNAPLWRDYAAGRISRDDLQRLRFERTLQALGADSLDARATGALYLSRYGAHWRWVAGAEAAFHAVADRLPVGLLTNGFTDQQRGKLARFPDLERRAATVVISEEVGVMKPNPGIFSFATRAAGLALGRSLDPAEILYVGDSLHSDVEGGTEAGWRVAWFGGDAAHRPAGDVFCFAEWEELLKRLPS